MKVTITGRRGDESDFRAELEAQGCFKVEISGTFVHRSTLHWDESKVELNAHGSVNGIPHWRISEILSLIGNGDMTIGEEVLDGYFDEPLEVDHARWADWRLEQNERAAREEKFESACNEKFFQRSAGF